MDETYKYIGHVNAFYGLNVRENPSKDGKIKFVIPRTLEVGIKDYEETDIWVEIYSKDFQNSGYAMKEFIDIVPNPIPAG